MQPQLSSITVGVKDIKRATAFYRDVIGFALGRSDEAFRYAQFDFGLISLRLVGEEDNQGAAERERNFSLSIAVEDVEVSYRQLKAKGVNFAMPPTRQPWGAVMARFTDPEGNLLYLMKE